MTPLPKMIFSENWIVRSGLLPFWGELAKHFLNKPEDPRDQLAALHRAEVKAKVEIRAVLDRFACEVGVLRSEVDNAMFSVEETLDDLACDTERSFVEAIENVDH